MRKTFSLPVAATAAGGGVTPPPADTVDNIEHSVRFNSADSAYLSRTPSSAGNQKTFTLSFWYKRSTLSTNQGIVSTDNASFTVKTNTDLLQTQILAGGYNIVWQTGAVFRDPSAWYHVVISVDTTQSAAADVVTLYVNNVEQTLTATTYSGSYTANVDTGFNGTGAQSIGRGYTGAVFYYSDHYLANIHNVDGQALTPSSFGFTDSNGVWQPKAFSGSYGTNGFYLDFADTSSATALGNDVSGNNNDFTPSGLVAGPAYTANSFSTEFDGDGDYLSIPDDPSLDFGTDDYTVEAWIYPAAVSGLKEILTKGFGFQVYHNNADIYLAVSALSGGSYDLQSSFGTLTTNQWYHVAVTRSGGTTRAFLNGTLGLTSTASTTIHNNTNAFGVAYYDPSPTNYFFNGKVSNVRVIKGRALYTAAFTPPTTALTATDDTVLLTCQDATVRDNSNIGHDVTASGDVAVVNEGPFNGYSGSFDGTGDYLTISNSADHNPGTGDFTIEGWFKTSATVSYQTIISKYGAPNATYGWYFGLDAAGTGFRAALFDGSSTTGLMLTGGSNLNDGAWHHFAVTRSGTSAKLFIDGTSVSSATNSFNVTATSDLRISGYPGTYRDWNGQLSNIRIVKGQALYTADFTPPTADLTTTSQGATASNVKLLTCQNSTFIDNSPSAHTITATNATTISVNPHTDKYSVTFDGTGDYLSIPANTDLQFGTGDWTIEHWVYIPSGTSMLSYWRSSVGVSGDSNTVNAASIYYGDGTFGSTVVGEPAFIGPSNAYRIYSGVDIRGRWAHVAVTKSSNTVRLFVDGILKASQSDSNDYNATGSTLIGVSTLSSNNYFLGKISNLRVIKGQALYTSNFLPSKEDLTTTSQGATASNVKLLTCQSYKIQDNSPSAHTITVNGDAKPSTVAPFVTSGAGSFDGTGDYLTVPSSTDFALGTGDFTIEFWANPTAAWSTGDTVLASGTVNQTDTWLMMVATNKLLFRSNGTTDIEQASASLSGWNHIAAVRSGSTVNLYLNGTSVGSGTYANSISANAITIGSQPGGSGEYTGYLSNLRISKGLARYTSNFTPPTEDFDPTDQDTVLLALQGNTLDDLAGDHAVSALGNAATSTVSPFEPVDGSDAMLDSPTNYGSGDTVRGNYCTLNPLSKATNGGSTNGNLEYLSSGGYPNDITGTMAVSSGKWYYEAFTTNNAYGSGNPVFYAGFLNLDTWDHLFNSVHWNKTGFYGFSFREGARSINGTQSAWGSGVSQGTVIGVALDLDAGEIEIYSNGTSVGVLATGLSGTFIPDFGSYTGSTGQAATVNFGQQPFKYPVAGYKAWCSTNLPTPAVADGSTAMDVALYTGTVSSLAVSTPNMSPDLVWIKRRNNTWLHRIYDSIRGAGTTTALYTNSTGSEGSINAEDLDSFDSTGFTVGPGPVSPANGINATGEPFVAWTWDAGSSTVSNTDGDITSQVRANPTTGISIVSFTTTSSQPDVVGHGLGKTPGLIIIKDRDVSPRDWWTWHTGIANTEALKLNSTSNKISLGSDSWSPTSTTFSVNTVATSGNAHIAYCFAPVEGFSAFGSFTGSTSNTFVYTGMRPRWLMIKRTDTTGSWQILDTEREGYNVDNDPLWADLGNQEGTTDIADILSNGFKMRDGATGDYIYAAFAEHPFKTSRAR